MADNPIPEDLKDAVIYALTVQVGELNDELVRRGRTIESQQSLLDKYDADNTALMQENAKLKAQVERMSAPVTSVEEISSLATFDNALRNHCDRKQAENAMGQALGWLIAARHARKEPAWGASENIAVLPEEDHHA
jgi:septal ring factor EnvC (AmiA/AmiB activator)